MNWITDYETADNDAVYIVFAIADGKNGTYLQRPDVMMGWELKRLIKRCYAAIPMPRWNPIENSLSTNLVEMKDQP